MRDAKIINNVISYNSGHYARERLKYILMADRIGCTPDVISRMRDDIRKCISAYVNIDAEHMTVQLSESLLTARIPIIGIHMKKEHEDENETRTTDRHDNREEIQADRLQF